MQNFLPSNTVLKMSIFATLLNYKKYLTEYFLFIELARNSIIVINTLISYSASKNANMIL